MVKFCGLTNEEQNQNESGGEENACINSFYGTQIFSYSSFVKFFEASLAAKQNSKPVSLLQSAHPNSGCAHNYLLWGAVAQW